MAKTLPPARGWLGWMLVVAGGLGMTLPAGAEPTPAPENARLDAIQVKLAWLGDRDTFACLLGAHPMEAGLEISGRVPNEKVHKRALALAHNHSTLKIADRIEVNPHMIKRQPSEGSTEMVQRGAVALLYKAFGDRAQKYRVTAAPNGVVMVAGTAASFEEKLLVSQELRLLNPCACVLNQLIVDRIERDGRSYQAVSAEDRHSADSPSLLAKQSAPAETNLPAGLTLPAQEPQSPFAGSPPLGTNVAIAPEPQPAGVSETFPSLPPPTPVADSQTTSSYALPPIPAVPEKGLQSKPDRPLGEKMPGSITMATLRSGPLVATPAATNPGAKSASPAHGRAVDVYVFPSAIQAEPLPLPPLAGKPSAEPRAPARKEQDAVRTVAFTTEPIQPVPERLPKDNTPEALPKSVTLPAADLSDSTRETLLRSSGNRAAVPEQRAGDVKPALARASASSDNGDSGNWIWAGGLAIGSVVLIVALVCLKRFFSFSTASEKKEKVEGENKNSIHPAEIAICDSQLPESKKLPREEPKEIAPADGKQAPRTVSPVAQVASPSARLTAPAGTEKLNPEPGVSVRWIGPQTVRLGQPVTCHICARNVSSRPVQQVVVRHELPAGVTVQGSDPPAIREGTWLSWPVGTLQPGQEQRIELHLLPETKGDLSCEAQVSFTGSCTLRMQVREPRLALEVTAPDKVVLGQAANLLAIVTNRGDGVAENVKITATLPGGLEHAGERNVVMELGNLAPQEKRTVQLVCLTKEGGLQEGDLVATADGADAVRDRIAVEVLQAQLALALTGPKMRYIDRHATYTIRVTNPGSAPASNVTIAHPIPHGFQYHAASAGGRQDETGTVSWFIGDLLPGQSGEVSLDLLAIAAGACTHRALAQGIGGLKAQGEIVTRVEGLSALQMEIVNLEDPVEVGSETAYEIRVTNAGSRAEAGLELTCTLPEGMEFLGARCAAGAGFLLEGSEIRFEPLAELEPRAETVYRVQVVGQAAGDLRFRAHLTARGLPAPVVREKSTKVYSDELAVR